MRYPGADWWGNNYATSNANVWTTITSATTLPAYPGQATDWERAAVKAEPDDEFSWLRKRIREVEEMAFT